MNSADSLIASIQHLTRLDYSALGIAQAACLAWLCIWFALGVRAHIARWLERVSIISDPRE